MLTILHWVAKRFELHLTYNHNWKNASFLSDMEKMQQDPISPINTVCYTDDHKTTWSPLFEEEKNIFIFREGATD